MIAQAPPAVVEIAQRIPRQEAGVVLYRLRRVFDVHAGPMHRHDEMQLAVVTQDGRVVKVRVLEAFEGGNPLDAQRILQIENQYEHPKASDIFHRPFDPAYVQEYTFQSLDPTTYRFTSAVRDASHGDGTFRIDDAGNVVKYEYAPNVMPQYATSGTITYERSQVLAGLWEVRRETHEYRGHYLFFGGGASAVVVYDSFQKFDDLPSAMAALAKTQPASVSFAEKSIRRTLESKSRPHCVSSSTRGSERRATAPHANRVSSSAAPIGPET